MLRLFHPLIPAQAGIQAALQPDPTSAWVPAFAEMSGGERG